MLLAIWFMLLLSVPLVWGQFPAVCNTPDSLNAKECCPNDCSGRGNCMDITNDVVMSWNSADESVVEILRNGPANDPNESWPLDVRYQWPLRVFERVCNCSTGWGGYDCSRCDFGYVVNGDRCVKQNDENQLPARENFAELDPVKRSEYIRVIRAAKNEMEERWAVVVREPTDSNGSFVLQNVSTYDMFVTLHALAGREQDTKPACKDVLGGVKIDFAHQGPAFLTWHRYYLLIVESEFRRVAEGMGITNFTLPYWDWQLDNEAIFHNDLFGTPSYNTKMQVVVSGTLFENWPTVCDQHYRLYADESVPCREVRRLCNVNDDRLAGRRLERGKAPKLMDDDLFLPDESSVVLALVSGNNNDQYGFRNRLEGFVDLCPGNSPQCIKYVAGDMGTHNNLHNAVHIFLGGHMRIVPSASNDPIFFLHHANVDRLFESWIRKFNGNLPDYSMTASGGHPGHNLNDYLVPFFPLRTNADMYKRSSELGFRYDMLQQTDNLPSDDSLTSMPCTSTCMKGGYSEPVASPTPIATPTTSTTDSSNSIYHIQLYLLLFGFAIAAILM